MISAATRYESGAGSASWACSRSSLTVVSLTASGTRLGCKSTERSALSSSRSWADRPKRPNSPSESPRRLISAALLDLRELENFAVRLIGETIDSTVGSLHDIAHPNAHRDAFLARYFVAV